MSSQSSQLAVGWVRHRRFAPKPHQFHYAIHYYWLDLDEVKQIFKFSPVFGTSRWGLLSFYRNDYLPGDPDLKGEVQKRIFDFAGVHWRGKVRLLTQIRQFGHCFNPVSFFFCFADSGQLEFIVAEITNTPWKERYARVLDCRGQSGHRFRFQFNKEFHVSPFMPMALLYDWTFSLDAKRVTIHMECNQQASPNVSHFDATLRLHTRPLNLGNIAAACLQRPWLSVMIVVGIHWQAFLLWMKRVPVFNHPKKGRLKE